MWRTFGLQTLSGTAQPLLGDKLTAALPIAPNGVDPILTVASTTNYQQGDRIVIDPGLNTQDEVLVITIKSSTQMQCSLQGATMHAHAVNAVLQLDIPAAEIIVQTSSGAANSVFLGTDSTVTNVGGGKAFYEVIPGQPFRMTNSGQYNSVRTNDAWMAGTATQTVIVAAQVI